LLPEPAECLARRGERALHVRIGILPEHHLSVVRHPSPPPLRGDGAYAIVRGYPPASSAASTTVSRSDAGSNGRKTNSGAMAARCFSRPLPSLEAHRARRARSPLRAIASAA